MEGLTKASAQQPGILTLGCGIRGPGSKGIGDLVGLVHVVTLAWLGKVVIHIMCASCFGRSPPCAQLLNWTADMFNHACNMLGSLRCCTYTKRTLHIHGLLGFSRLKTHERETASTNTSMANFASLLALSTF